MKDEILMNLWIFASHCSTNARRMLEAQMFEEEFEFRPFEALLLLSEDSSRGLPYMMCAIFRDFLNPSPLSQLLLAG